jgi:hypothetical protein
MTGIPMRTMRSIAANVSGSAPSSFTAFAGLSFNTLPAAAMASSRLH